MRHRDLVQGLCNLRFRAPLRRRDVMFQLLKRWMSQAWIPLLLLLFARRDKVCKGPVFKARYAKERLSATLSTPLILLLHTGLLMVPTTLLFIQLF